DRVAGDEDALEELVRVTDRPKAWLLQQALDTYLEIQSWQVRHIEKGAEELKAGKGIDHDRVAAWLETWGAEEESAPPK
ncbi:MAG: CopG family ribbon-helix-helix protein, partial [Alphaproteobacteria bacterium]